MTVSAPSLVTLELPCAPPVTTAPAAPLRRPKALAIGLVVLGVLLTFGPIAGGLFSRTAAGQQMVNAFAPHMQPGAIARYDREIRTLRDAAAGVDAVYRSEHVPAGEFPGLDQFRRESAAIVGRSSELVARVRATEPQYEQVDQIGGFDRIPFLMVAAGIVAIYGGCVLLVGRRSQARSVVLLVVLAGVAVAAYPFVSNLSEGASAGQQMLRSLAPVMTPHKVHQLQDDFIVLVNTDGELDTTFRAVPQRGRAATEVSAMVGDWPKLSSDFASLVGTINDNIGNFNALDGLDSFTRDVGLPGMGAFPWVLVSVGVVMAGLAITALPRRRKET
ncbi:MAG TPA: hypothetical protein VGF87_01400 [Acidimicrobiales bacterium]|jgi:hypothetical protein